MEDTLGEKGWAIMKRRVDGLNPCSNGRYSRSLMSLCQKEGQEERLNPCSNGRYSRRHWNC